MAAEFHGHTLHQAAGPLPERLAHRGGAGEGQVLQRRVEQDRVADCTRPAGRDHVDDTRRQSGLGEQPGRRERAERRLAMRLDHKGAAGRERRRALTGDHREGIVSGGDQQRRTDRFAEHEQPLCWIGRRHDLAVEPASLGRVPAHEIDTVVDLAAGLCQRLALLGGDDPGQIFPVPLEQLSRLEQDRLALDGWHRGPAGCRLLGRDCAAQRRRLVLVRHMTHDFQGRRIGNRDRLVGGPSDPLTVD